MQYPATRAEPIVGHAARRPGGRPVPLAGGREGARGAGVDEGPGRPHARRSSRRCPAATRSPSASTSCSTWTPSPRRCAAASRYFYFRTHKDKEKAILYWREGEKGAEKVLLDPNAWSKDGTVSLGTWVPSWDGAQGGLRPEAQRRGRGHAPRAGRGLRPVVQGGRHRGRQVRRARGGRRTARASITSGCRWMPPSPWTSGRATRSSASTRWAADPKKDTRGAPAHWVTRPPSSPGTSAGTASTSSSTSCAAGARTTSTGSGWGRRTSACW